MKKTFLIISLAFVLISSCTKKVADPTYDIDFLEVYSHAQELVDLNYYVNDYYVYIQHPDDETKVYFVNKISEEIYQIDSWVQWRDINNNVGYKTWYSEVRYEKGIFEGVIIKFN